MNVTARVARLEKRRGGALPLTQAQRGRLYAQVIAKAEAIATGAELPPADWRGVDPATVEHRRRLLAWIEAQ